MRLSTWLILGLSGAYIFDLFYFGGTYGMTAISVFRHVGIGVLEGLIRLV